MQIFYSQYASIFWIKYIREKQREIYKLLSKIHNTMDRNGAKSSEWAWGHEANAGQVLGMRSTPAGNGGMCFTKQCSALETRTWSGPFHSWNKKKGYWCHLSLQLPWNNRWEKQGFKDQTPDQDLNQANAGLWCPSIPRGQELWVTIEPDPGLRSLGAWWKQGQNHKYTHTLHTHTYTQTHNLSHHTHSHIYRYRLTVYTLIHTYRDTPHRLYTHIS